MLLSNVAIKEYKGALTENYVLCQLKCVSDLFAYYYSRADSKLAIDFVVHHNGVVTPVEVKAEENLRSDRITNVPLYAVVLPFFWHKP